MRPLDLEKFAGMLIVLALIVVPCIPGLWFMYLFLRKLVQLIKDIGSEYLDGEKRIPFIAEYFQEQLEKQDRIRELGKTGYFIQKLKQFWKDYSFFFYAAGMILLMTVIMFRRVLAIALTLLSNVPLSEILAVVVMAVEILILVYYILCKTHRGKWKAAIALLVLVAAKQLWALAQGDFTLSADDVLILMLFLAVHHYGKWKQELVCNIEAMHQRLDEEQYAEDDLIQMYLALKKQRMDSRERVTVFTRLQDDDELDEMRIYLNWLEKQAHGVETANEEEKNEVTE